MTITISDMMRKTVETIQEMASVQEAAKKMKEKNVSSLVVLKYITYTPCRLFAENG
jgi:CBS domain-containing protein